MHLAAKADSHYPRVMLRLSEESVQPRCQVSDPLQLLVGRVVAAADEDACVPIGSGQVRQLSSPALWHARDTSLPGQRSLRLQQPVASMLAGLQRAGGSSGITHLVYVPGAPCTPEPFGVKLQGRQVKYLLCY